MTAAAPGAVVLGARRFTGPVPWKSGWKRVTEVFTFGQRKESVGYTDGLRGYSADMLGWLCSIPETALNMK
jgi:hypothetical protein